jgi:alpha-beta hydrolase superfamily lysophospholipase
MTIFCLVHGAWHGAWCWQRLMPELEGAGHQVIAIELPSDRPGTTCSDYAELISEELDAAGDDVVLVGHSIAGLTIPLVAQARPLQRLVYLAALIPRPGSSMTEQFERGEEAIIFEGGRELNEDETLSRWIDRDAAIAAMYHDAPEEQAERAWSQLRPQSRAAQDEVCPLATMPEVATAYIVCRDDRMASTEWGRRTAEGRLGAEVVEIAGGHSPFLSRPRELAEVLVGLV